MSSPAVDYDALARQHGGTPAVDYDALATQHGALPGQSSQVSPSDAAYDAWKAANPTMGAVADVATGFGKMAAHTMFEGGDLIRRGLGMQRVIQRPEVQQGITPTNTAQKIGGGIEQAAEFAIPGSAVAKGGKLIEAATKLPVARVLGKAVLQAISAGGVAGAQSGGDPTTMRNAALAAGGTSAVMEGAAPALANLGKKAAVGTYMSAMKPPTSLDQAARAKLFQTAQLEGIPVSEGGLASAGAKIDDLQRQVSDAINQAHASGTPGIPTADIATRLQDTRATFANQLAPSQSDMASIDKVEQDLLGNNPSVMTLPETQEKKIGTYGILRKKGAYGEQSTAENEALKAVARGAKEELVSRVPELAALNPREGSIIQLEGALQKAVARIQNVNKIPMRSLLAAGAGIAGGGAHGGTLEGAGAGAALGLLAYALDDPWVKSRLAIAIGRGADALASNPGAVSRAAAPLAGYGASALSGQPRTTPPPQ